MVNKYFEGKVPNYNGTPNEVDKEFEEYTNSQIDKFEKMFNNYEIATSIQEIWNIISRTNKYIDETMPWALAKEEKTEELKSCMYHLIENLRKISILIRPFMLETSNNILRQIGVNNEQITWDSLKEYKTLENIQVIAKGEPIFMRLNSEEEIEYIKSLMK